VMPAAAGGQEQERDKWKKPFHYQSSDSCDALTLLKFRFRASRVRKCLTRTSTKDREKRRNGHPECSRGILL
jgi:hypothetical protein